MTRNAFGGRWTEDKLSVLQKYLHFYVQALSRERFELVYIDTFAGTGRCSIRDTEDGRRIIDGSAKIALDCEGFSRYVFIESSRAHADELEQLRGAHPRGGLARVARGKASDMLWPFLMGVNWQATRGVLFLDPYGLQCDWPMLERIAATKALDVFFLVSISGLYRNAAIDRRSSRAQVLTRFLGTDRWSDEVYVQQQDDLFDDPYVTRAPGYQAILHFTTSRLAGLFPYVSAPVLLGQTGRAPLFALYFAVSNPSKPALALAARVSEDILKKLR